MNKVRVLQVVAMLWLAAWSSSAPAATFWTGHVGDRDWFNENNWDPVGIPGAGADVSVPVATDILITNETAELASFTMAGGTMTFSNWTTRLRADTVGINGGTLTLPAAFTNGGMSNRVWIVCGDFTLADGASIDVDGRGYAAGHGDGAGGVRSGGGHGGFGSCGDPGTATWWDNRGFPYGNASAPVTPGSGGGSSTDAGSGGGAVWIDASGVVTIDGAVIANGANAPSGHGGGGAGGSIYIVCETIRGDGNGLLSVHGGNSSSSTHWSGGPAGGGRIAILYNPVTQASVPGPKPPVKMNARQGTYRRNSFLAESGTVYLPDALFLSSHMSAEHWQHVMLVIPGFTDWHLDALTIGGAFGIKELETIRVDGNLTLASDGLLRLEATSTNPLFPGSGTAMIVGGRFTIENNASLILVSDLTNGIAPYIECGTFNLRSGGTINADRRGYEHLKGPGKGDDRGGAGYGGHGSGGRSGDRGAVYGQAHAPIEPGSGGARSNYGGRGGGLARISAWGAMQVDGTVAAWGMNLIGVHAGGGSGGGIMLSANRFQGAGHLSVNGGNGGGVGGSGGGGRIAVWTPFLSYDFVQAIADREHPPAAASVVDPSQWPGWTGTYSVAKGTGGENNDQAEDGTVFFGQLPVGTLIKIR